MINLNAQATIATVTAPSPSIVIASLLPSGFPGSGGTGSWSSLIGIVTAIIGNILISFALSIQRYAHIRLHREAEALKQQQRRKKRHEYGPGSSEEQEQNAISGVSDTDIKRRPLNHGQGRDVAEVGHNDAQEGDPLLPKSRPERTPSNHQQAVRPDDEEPKQTSYLRSPNWWAGIIMMTVGEAGNFLAYGFAPASIVSPLGVVALISNCIIAPIMFKETFRKRDFLGVVIAVAGAVTVVLSANSDNPKLGPQEIWELIATWEFETYLGITVGSIIVLMALSSKYGSKSILIDLGLVGLLGGYTALSTKGVASLLSYKLWRLITFPVTYLLFFILIFTAVMQIRYINRALKRFDATQVIPIQFVMFTLSVILGSAILYRDFKRTTREDAIKFVGGCFLTFCGVGLITTARPPREEDDDDRDPEPVDAIDLAEGEIFHNSQEESSSSARVFSSGPPSQNDRSTRVASAAASRRSSEHETPYVNNLVEIEPSSSPSEQPVLASRIRPSTPTPRAGTSNAQLKRSATSPTPGPSLSNAESSSVVNHLPSTPRPLSSRMASDLVLEAPQTPIAAHRLLSERSEQRHRHSVPGTLPTPMLVTSPLSGSLSAMVAELRRTSSIRSVANGKTVQPIRSAALIDEESGLQTLPSRRSRRTTGQSEVINAPEPLQTESNPGLKRGRSLSNTLGELLRDWIHDGDGQADDNGVRDPDLAPASRPDLRQDHSDYFPKQPSRHNDSVERNEESGPSSIAAVRTNSSSASNRIAGKTSSQ